MSISALSSNLVSDLSQQQNPFQQVKQDFKQLASALQSGDLSDAQSAFSSIQTLLQSQSPSGSPALAGSKTIQSDFSQLGQALQSGDLSQATSAFSQLKTDVQASSPSGTGTTTASTGPEDQYTPSTSQTPSPAQQVQQDYAQLGQALQSGNLTNAQSAYSALAQELQTQDASSSNTTTTGSASTSDDPISTDFSALGQALSSGNLTQAQGAFSQLQGDVKTAEQANAAQSQTAPTQTHHHHHHHGGGGSASSTSSSSSSTGSSTASSVSVYA
jgi:outer membrane protein assembly factor BamD (BamD/ComL family)